MRWTAAILFAALLAPAVPASGAPTEVLSLHSMVLRAKGGTLTFSFDIPEDREARDLRTATIAVQVGAEPVVAYAPKSKGLKVDRWGYVAKLKAPKRAKARVAQFVLRASGGTFVAKIAGLALDIRALPKFELSFGGHVYRYTQTTPTEPPGGTDPPVVSTPPAILPEGPVAFTTVYRATVQVTPPPANAVLRNQTELANYLNSMTFGAGFPTALTSVDFSQYTVLVVAGDATGGTIKPWSVRLTGVTVQGGVMLVNYQKLWGTVCCTYLDAPPATTPPFSAFFQFVTIPKLTQSATFIPLSVKSQNPWN